MRCGSNATATCCGSRSPGRRTRNAFDAALIAELAEAFVDVGRARAVVLAGDGPSFCAGADVQWMRASVDLDLEANIADANALRGMLEAIDRCPAPVVARVQGHALGGGAGLVACSDIAVADERAVFAFSEVKLGIIPAVISPFALAKIGPSAARRYFVTGERFDAATALRIGLVHEVAADLDAGLERVLAELANAGPRGPACEEARPRPARRARDGAPDRGTADERRGAGGTARLPRAAAPARSLADQNRAGDAVARVPETELRTLPARSVRCRKPRASVVRSPPTDRHLPSGTAAGSAPVPPPAAWPQTTVRMPRRAWANGRIADRSDGFARPWR